MAFGAIPVDRAAESGSKIGFCGEAERLARAGDVEASAWLSIGLRRIKYESSGEPGEVRHERGQIANADLESGADVHRLGTVISLRCERNRFGGIFDEQELAGRVAAPPAHDL